MQLYHYLWTQETDLNGAFLIIPVNQSIKSHRKNKNKTKRVRLSESLEKWSMFVCLHSFVYLQSLAQLVQREEGGLESKGGVIT